MATRTYTATNGLGQIHTYGGGLKNQTNHWDNLAFGPIKDFSHGHHARSGGGYDTFNFTGLDRVSGTVVGRLEDFDPSRDQIRIEGPCSTSTRCPTMSESSNSMARIPINMQYPSNGC
ncbi:hypothetical protein [Frigidibacter mobilis]|uniref:hypothetical protein n=1 Tax=Frigidibacter mobilis TaxID=1335048 RepID=UPI001411E39A|nr:hypothetical protein [Frigidibacter mobilis]